MKVFTCVGFEGYWPVGTAAVIVAPDMQAALLALNKHLADLKLPPVDSFESIKELDITQQNCVILCDGNY